MNRLYLRYLVFTLVSILPFGQGRARPLEAADRGIVLRHNEVEVGLDATVGLTSSKEGKQVAIDTGYRHDRHGGLSAAVGLFESFELGVALKVVHWQKGLEAQFGGVDFYGTWAFLPFVGVELGVIISRPVSEGPGQQTQTYLTTPSLRLGLPFRFTLLESRLAIFSRTDLLFSFPQKETAMKWFTDLGLTLNITPWLFFEGYAGFSKSLKGMRSLTTILDEATKNLEIPVGGGLGVTLFGRWDVFVSFNLHDLKERGADARNVTLSSTFRF